MDRYKSADEVREEHIQVLGPVLGIFYHALQRDVTWIHAKWLEFRKLYARSEKRIDLLNEAAAFFFRVVQDVLWEDVLLHIARLTDPPKSAGRPNLTINRLAELIPDPIVAEDVHNLVNTAIQKCSFAREWRNRHLAHRDLDLAMETRQATALPGVSRQSVIDALSAISAVLNRVESHYFDSEVAFGHFLVHDDADALVHHLVVAVRYGERKRERFRQGKPLPEDLEPEPEA
ncbi:MAG: hypothetical protein JSV33_15060 [bacterium]|nr:MAG: hypothetical protein JSV33_15060 [bacterium]